jgi:hypothetical protein
MLTIIVLAFLELTSFDSEVHSFDEYYDQQPRLTPARTSLFLSSSLDRERAFSYNWVSQILTSRRKMFGLNIVTLTRIIFSIDD